MRADLAAFVRMYEPHEAFEDTVIYPALRAASTPRTLTLLAERFHDLADAQFGEAALHQVLAAGGRRRAAARHPRPGDVHALSCYRDV